MRKREREGERERERESKGDRYIGEGGKDGKGEEAAAGVAEGGWG